MCPGEGQFAEHFAKYEGVARCSKVAGSAELRVGLSSEHRFDEGSHRFDPEGRWPHDGGGGPGEEPSRAPIETVQRGYPRRRNDGRADAVQTVLQVGEPFERRRVNPLGVVYCQQYRCVGSKVGNQPVKAVKSGERCRPGRARTGLQDRQSQARSTPGEATTGTFPHRRDHRAEELAHHPEPVTTLELAALGSVDLHAGVSGSSAGGPDQRSLADAWRTFDEQQSPSARLGRLQQFSDDHQRLAPVEEQVPSGDRLVPPARHACNATSAGQVA